MRHVWAGHLQLGRGLGGQLPRRVSGGICGVAAGHAKGEGQADEVEVKGFKGGRKRNSSGEESGEKENARKRELGPPLRDVIAFLYFISFISFVYGYILYLTAISPWKEKQK